MLIACWLLVGFLTHVARSVRVRLNLGFGLSERYPNGGGFFAWLGLTGAGCAAVVVVFVFWPLVLLLWAWAVRLCEKFPNLVMQSTIR
jgi:hypothetical protein